MQLWQKLPHKQELPAPLPLPQNNQQLKRYKLIACKPNGIYCKHPNPTFLQFQFQQSLKHTYNTNINTFINNKKTKKMQQKLSVYNNNSGFCTGESFLRQILKISQDSLKCRWFFTAAEKICGNFL
eukprot:TRINITY_DN13399_c0_g2_i1.p6 TRINITY_DN13399_c0_g2~~TRINITY_DN13399_c0_g2_i1.p6  ORF type:complete len:126 (+),score=5.27 TRINITY_DN13399_c0_g2_i1:615-992(+)